jgi:RNA polymerase sigma factor (sigma-70 family)
VLAQLEASTLQAPAVPASGGTSLGVSLLRLRSDEQLVALFRAGNDDAFRAIHDRYRQRLFAYTRQMLPRRQDAEDALQDVFVRAYAGLRANDRQVALRAWLYRVAHNRCVDELRRPLVSPAEVFELISVPEQDPVAQADQRESLRRLIADVRRLPEQQRSALLMRELSGMSYAELAVALETTVPAVKSLLVRARIALAQALEARDTSCAEIREELVLAQDRRVRPNAMARRHMRDCAGCREFRHDLRGVSAQLRALAPGIGPVGVAAKLLGFGFGGGAGGGAAMSGGGAAAGSMSAIGTGGAVASVGALASGAGHVATLLVATVVTAGGAVEIQHTIAAAPAHHQRAHHTQPQARAASAQSAPASVLPPGYVVSAPVVPAVANVAPAAAPVYHPVLSAPPAAAPVLPAKPAAAASHPAKAGSKTGKAGGSQTTNTGTTTGDGSTSTGLAPAGAPVISATAVSDGTSSTDTPGTSSTPTGTGAGETAGASDSTNSGPTANQASAGGSASSSTGTSGTTSPGSSTSSSGSATSTK